MSVTDKAKLYPLMMKKLSPLISKLHFLVTGGGGFIGSNIVEELIRYGCSVRVLDNFSTGKWENLEPFRHRVEVLEGDIRSYHLVQQAVKGVDVILHLAALPSVPRSINDPITTNEVNVGGTLNVLEAARQAGVMKVVYASSSSLYGNNAILPKNEQMVPNPLSPYAVAKLAGENYCRVFSEIYGLKTIALRYFNVFGPRQDPDSPYAAVIPRFIKKVMQGGRPVIYGDGEQSRDFTYVANVVYANLLAVIADCGDGQPINCACAERTSLNDLVEQIGIQLGKQVKPIYHEPRSGDIQHSLADISLAHAILDYRPLTSFGEGLNMTIEAFKALSVYAVAS